MCDVNTYTMHALLQAFQRDGKPARNSVLRRTNAVGQCVEDDLCCVADKHHQDDDEHETVEHITNCPPPASRSSDWDRWKVCRVGARTSGGDQRCGRPDVVSGLTLSVADGVRRLLRTLVLERLFAVQSIMVSCWTWQQMTSCRKRGRPTRTRLSTRHRRIF